MSTALQECTPFCNKFRCDRKPSAYQVTRKGKQKVIWCSWVDDMCDGPWCKFGICTARKMTESGKCKDLPVKATAQTGSSRSFDDAEFDMDKGIPKKFVRELEG